MSGAEEAPRRRLSGAEEAPRRRMALAGLHHVTLVAGDLGRSTAFYRDVLGLTLVRETASDDDPGARHFWFGDAAGTPGTLVSLLEYPGLSDGVVGRGSTQHLAFAVSGPDEVDAWERWLQARGVPCSAVLTRGGLHSVYLRDPDGHVLEITAAADGR